MSDIQASPEPLEPLLLTGCIFGPSVRLSSGLMSCLSLVGCFVSLACMCVSVRESVCFSLEAGK